VIFSTVLTVLKLVWGNELGGWADPGKDKVAGSALSLLMARLTCALVASEGAVNIEDSTCPVGVGFCRWVEGCVNESPCFVEVASQLTGAASVPCGPYSTKARKGDSLETIPCLHARLGELVPSIVSQDL